MPARLAALALLWLGMLAVPAWAAPCTIAELEWLKGIWREQGKDEQTEERWTDASGALLLGSAWTVAKGKPVFGEIMTIEPDGAGLVMRLRHFSDSLSHAWEGKDPPILFRFSACQNRSAVLDGQGRSAREHLTYRRLDDHRLQILGDFIHNGKPDHHELTLLKVTE
jgi:Domain of unknown function (DUF6265)